jgi:adenylylsulfate kinase-like enzyme
MTVTQSGIHPIVIWVTGLSGSGKTTLCTALHGLLKPNMPNLVRLDGDEIREAFGEDIGHAEADRIRQIGRIQRISRILAVQNLAVLVAALYASPELLAWNRENLPGYFEVYLNADLALLRERDSKGLYRGAESGRITNVVGIDIAWQIPQHADLTLNAASGESPQRMAAIVLEAIQAKQGRLFP